MFSHQIPSYHSLFHSPDPATIFSFRWASSSPPSFLITPINRFRLKLSPAYLTHKTDDSCGTHLHFWRWRLTVATPPPSGLRALPLFPLVKHHVCLFPEDLLILTEFKSITFTNRNIDLMPASYTTRVDYRGELPFSLCCMMLRPSLVMLLTAFVWLKLRMPSFPESWLFITE